MHKEENHSPVRSLDFTLKANVDGYVLKMQAQERSEATWMLGGHPGRLSVFGFIFPC